MPLKSLTNLQIKNHQGQLIIKSRLFAQRAPGWSLLALGSAGFLASLYQMLVGQPEQAIITTGLAFGGLFIVIGALATFSVRTIVINAPSLTATVTHQIWHWRRDRVTKFRKNPTVTIERLRKKVRDDRTRRPYLSQSYEVSLQSPFFQVLQLPTYLEARALAANIAQHLKVPILDQVGHSAVQRGPRHDQKPVKERLWSEKANPSLLPSPYPEHLLAREAQETTITLPRPDWWSRCRPELKVMVLPICLVLLLWLQAVGFSSPSATSSVPFQELALKLVCFCTAGLIGSIALTIWAKSKTCERFIVARDRVTFEQHHLLRTRRWDVPYNDLSEIYVGESVLPKQLPIGDSSLVLGLVTSKVILETKTKLTMATGETIRSLLIGEILAATKS